MKNRFVKSGLDLEAKMNELDQKAEKEKDVQDKTASLEATTASKKRTRISVMS